MILCVWLVVAAPLLGSTSRLAAALRPGGGVRVLPKMATARRAAALGEDSSAPEVLEEDPPAVIVGTGRIGTLLASLGDRDVLWTRESGFPADAPAAGPIYVCTRNDAIPDIIDATPEDRRVDLVFLQNGNIRDYLRSRGFWGTQCLVYFAVANKGDPPTDGVTPLNPEGLTAVRGKWGRAFKARLAKAGLKCVIMQQDDPFLRAMLEKLIWICVFNLVGQVHGNCTVGEVLDKYEDEVDALCAELAPVAGLAYGIKLKDSYLDRLKAYTRTVAHFPTAVKEFYWRNAWFVAISRRELRWGFPDPMPLHTKFLVDAGVMGPFREVPGDGRLEDNFDDWERPERR